MDAAKLPRLVPLPLACIRRGDSHPVSSCGYSEAHTRINQETHSPWQWSSRRVGENITEKEWQGLPGVAPEQQQPPHCNGRQWMKPSFSPPLLSHFGCRHRRCDSGRFARNEPFQFVHRGERRVWMWRGCVHSSCSSSSSDPAASSAIPA